MQTTESIILDFRDNRNYKFFADLIALNPPSIDELLAYCLTSKYPFPQYSSWLLSHVVEHHYSLILANHEKIIDTFLLCEEESANRNLCNVLTKLPKISYKEGELLNRYFDLLQKTETKVALKVYAIYQIVPFLKDYPELKFELKSIIQQGMQQETAAFIIAGKKVLRQLDKN